jgi:outer membrane protein assembly factor BamB
MPPWALAQSPLLCNDMVIVSIMGNSGLVAYDQATGKIRWRAEGVSGAAYCSPELVDLGNGQKHVVLVTNQGVVGVDPATGKVVWQCTTWKCFSPIPNVTSLGDGKLFCTDGYGAGSILIQVTGNQVKELWRIPQGSQIHQAIAVDGCIYFNGNSNKSLKEGLTCVDAADGKLLWKNGEAPKLDRGNFIYADGMFYLMDASGVLNLVQPNREALKIVSSMKVLSGKDIWAPMALSDGKLVLRDQSQMKCVDLKATH